MTVLLLGATGFLGGYLANRLGQMFSTYVPRLRSGMPLAAGRVTWLNHRVDATDPGSIGPVIDEARPDVVVNAIALKAGAEPRLLDIVNGQFPHQLASRAEAAGARVIHISTDGVFSGKRGSYTESDRPDADDVYGRSKLEGELRAPHVTLRTSFFGWNRRGIGLFEWLMAQPAGTVDGFVDYRFSGMAAALLADYVTAAVGRRSTLEGVYHVGGEPTTKYDVLAAAAARLRPDIRVVPVRRGSIDRTLDSSRFFAAIERRPPLLSDSLAAIGPCATVSPN